MGFINDGYLGLDIDGTSPVIGILATSLMSLCLITQLAIGVTACRQMTGEKQKVHTRFKVLFGLCLFCACTATTILIVWSPMFWPIFWRPLLPATRVHPGVLLLAVHLLANAYFFASLLTVLVLRLRVVFKEFMRMAKCTYFGFLIILLYLYSWPIVVVAVSITIDFDHATSYKEDIPKWVMVLFEILLSLFGVFFVTGSVLAVSFFVNNLRKLTISSLDTLTVPKSAEDVALSDQQQRTSALASRYMLLFAVAISTDIVMILLAFAVSAESGLKGVFFAADFCVNLLSVYLQFGFAEEHYLRCCGCLDKRWRRRTAKRVRRAIHRQSMGTLSLSTPTPSAGHMVCSPSTVSTSFDSSNMPSSIASTV